MTLLFSSCSETFDESSREGETVEGMANNSYEEGLLSTEENIKYPQKMLELLDSELDKPLILYRYYYQVDAALYSNFFASVHLDGNEAPYSFDGFIDPNNIIQNIQSDQEKVLLYSESSFGVFDKKGEKLFNLDWDGFKCYAFFNDMNGYIKQTDDGSFDIKYSDQKFSIPNDKIFESIILHENPQKYMLTGMSVVDIEKGIYEISIYDLNNEKEIKSFEITARDYPVLLSYDDKGIIFRTSEGIFIIKVGQVNADIIIKTMEISVVQETNEIMGIVYWELISKDKNIAIGTVFDKEEKKWNDITHDEERKEIGMAIKNIATGELITVPLSQVAGSEYMENGIFSIAGILY